MRKVVCPYCNDECVLVGGDIIYPHRKDLKDKKFWLCTPCNAYVGTHKNSKDHAPLGTVANESLRTERSKAHKVFDPMWRDGDMSRKDAYAWLARELNIEVNNCHIAMFDIETCKRAIQICMDYLE